MYKIKDFFKRNGIPIIVILLLLNLTFCESKRVEVYKESNSILTSELEVYKLRNKSLVTSTKVTEVSLEQLKKELEQSELDKEILRKFSNPKTVTKIITVTKIDTLRERYIDSIPIKFNKVGVTSNKNISYKYQSTEKGFQITDIVIPDTITTIVGEKRSWPLGKPTLTIDIHHTNPLIEDKGLKQLTIPPKSRWYESKILIFVTGALIGGFLVK